MFSEVAEIALVAARLRQFQQLLKTRVILILNFTRPHAITYTKSVLKAKTCASKPFRTELWLNPESHGHHKIKMVSICCESGSLVKSLLRRLEISTSELKIHQNG